jgi:uncharacterized protein YbjT (DUF2867 family)
MSTFGVGESWAHLSTKWRLLFRAVIGPQSADHARQELIVQTSDVEWTIVRPVALSDDSSSAPLRVAAGDAVSGMTVSRRAVARFLAEAVGALARTGRVVAPSSA